MADDMKNPDDDAEAVALDLDNQTDDLDAAMREAVAAVEEVEGERKGAGSAQAESDDSSDQSDQEVAKLRREIADLRDRSMRTLADFDNFRKRALKDREEAHHFGHQALVKDLLPSVDNLERAVEHARQATGGEAASALLEGVELVLRELQAVLAKHGVQAIDALGQPFDPSLHEAMAQVPDATRPPNTVVEVYQRGYQLRGRLLRPARVVVSRAAEGSGATGRQGD